MACVCSNVAGNTCGLSQQSACCGSQPCCCTVNGGVVNIDQGIFQNTPSNKIVNIPSLDLAYLTNCENNNDIDNTIYLNPTYLTWNDFVTLFYKNSGNSFYISDSNNNNIAISFLGKTYETTQTQKIPFSLSQQIIKAWAKKNNKPENSIAIPYKLQLTRQGFLTKSLATINGYQMSLSLDEAISNLLDENQIVVGDYETSATVKFNISYRDYFCPLDTSILVVFSIVTNIPCYKNSGICDLCPPYSNDTSCSRKSLNIDENYSLNLDLGSNGSCEEQTYFQENETIKKSCEDSIVEIDSKVTNIVSDIDGKMSNHCDEGSSYDITMWN